MAAAMDVASVAPQAGVHAEPGDAVAPVAPQEGIHAEPVDAVAPVRKEFVLHYMIGSMLSNKRNVFCASSSSSSSSRMLVL
jgi:hypothetical protein